MQTLLLIAFMVGSQQLLDHQQSPNAHISRIAPYIMIGATSILILRELLEVLSIGTDYFLTVRNWYDVNCVILLIYTADYMNTIIEDPSLDIPPTIFCITGFVLVLNIIFYFRATFLPFATFVGGLVAILFKLMPFIIVSLLLLLAFVYSYWITNDLCPSFMDCLLLTVTTIFTFEFDGGNYAIELLFMLIILMVLLNVVIAIVCDAWGSSSDLSTQLFWKYRLETIYENWYTEQILTYTRVNISAKIVDTTMRRIDSLWNTSYGSKDASFWEQAPYNIVTKKEHYDEPYEYFNPEQTREINLVKSLHTDLYWAKKGKGGKLTGFEKFAIVFRWLTSCIFYSFLVILGLVTGGLFWPEKFRLSLLIWDLQEREEIDRPRDVCSHS